MKEVKLRKTQKAKVVGVSDKFTNIFCSIILLFGIFVQPYFDSYTVKYKFWIGFAKLGLLTIGTQQKLRSLPRQLEVRIEDVMLPHDPTGCEMLHVCKVQANMKWN